MEYKLSKSEFYRIGYLLAGLFMFLFLFGIFNLSSYALTGQFTVSSNQDGSWVYYSDVYEFPSSYFHPEYAYPISTVSGSCSFSRASSAVTNVTVNVHVVTSQGDFVVCSSVGVGSTDSYSCKLQGYPISYYAECTGFIDSSVSGARTVSFSYSCDASVSNQTTNVTNDLSSIKNNTNQILALVGGQGGDIQVSSNYSDYDSWSVENSLYSFTTNSGFGGDFVNSNTPFSFSFPNYSGTSLAFTNVVYFAPVRGNKYKLMFDYYNNQADFTNDLDIALFNNNGRLRQFRSNDFIYTSYGNHKFYILEFDFDYDDSIPAFLLFYRVNTSATVTSPGIALYKRKYTLDDYMKFNRSQWDNIASSVSDTNQNIAQSVSDIGTAQSFETSAFTDFASSMNSSRLDSFSLSFASTPLLWCASIINTFYNNMPSGFQYLLMFVAFVGILVIVLNIAGRVVRRFGGD